MGLPFVLGIFKSGDSFHHQTVAKKWLAALDVVFVRAALRSRAQPTRTRWVSRLPLVDVVRRFYWLALLGIIVPHIRRVRGCLTLMLAAAANATATPAPARLTGS